MLPDPLLTLALGPILLLQGRLVRQRTPMLPEPPGERFGVAGEGPLLRLAVIGDSAAAGVGAAHQQDALIGQLVERLSGNHRVQWALHAATGATTRACLQTLRQLNGQCYDVVISSLGVNDITSGVSRRSWLTQQIELIRMLKEAFRTQLIILSGLPPMDRFPALPQPLRWYLGRRARRFNSDLENEVDRDPGAVFLHLRFTQNVQAMAPDGFHPGPAIYAQWARHAVDLIMRKVH